MRPGGVVWWKNRVQKISWDCPFNLWFWNICKPGRIGKVEEPWQQFLTPQNRMIPYLRGNIARDNVEKVLCPMYSHPKTACWPQKWCLKTRDKIKLLKKGHRFSRCEVPWFVRSLRWYSPMCSWTSSRTCAGNAAHWVLKVFKCNAPILYKY